MLFLRPRSNLFFIIFNSCLAINDSNSVYCSSKSFSKSYIFCGVIIFVLLFLKVSNITPWSFIPPRPKRSISITNTASYFSFSTSCNNSIILGLCIMDSPLTSSSLISTILYFSFLANFRSEDLCLFNVSNSPFFSASKSARDLRRYIATFILIPPYTVSIFVLRIFYYVFDLKKW